MNWGLVFLLAGAAAWGIYGAIGAHVDERGILIEPFFLIPLGYLGLGAGLLIQLLPRLKAVLRRRGRS